MQAQAIESLQLFQEMLTAIETEGILAALPYIDQMSAAGDELDAIVLPIEEHCNVAILDNDDDGTPEVGPGTVLAPDIDPSAPLGDYANPYPVGSAQPTDSEWTIQVDSVTPDGTQAVLDENSFNEEPEAGPPILHRHHYRYLHRSAAPNHSMATSGCACVAPMAPSTPHLAMPAA